MPRLSWWWTRTPASVPARESAIEPVLSRLPSSTTMISAGTFIVSRAARRERIDGSSWRSSLNAGTMTLSAGAPELLASPLTTKAQAWSRAPRPRLVPCARQAGRWAALDARSRVSNGGVFPAVQERLTRALERADDVGPEFAARGGRAPGAQAVDEFLILAQQRFVELELRGRDGAVTQD